MLRAQNLQFKRGDDVLFENLNFVVHPGQRVAVAGRNGAGKSTLFQLILGQLQVDTGELTLPDGWQLGYMQQDAAASQRPALEYVVDGHKKLRQVEQQIETVTEPSKLATLHSDLHDLGGYEAQARAGEILYGLGFSATDFNKPFDAFSGGWRIRLSLAQALMAPCDLLLLDEPTNHLDLETIMWLENWLARFEGTVLLIAHDRAFLDACADHTLYLTANTGKLYNGNYTSCERQRAEQLEQEQATNAKREAQAQHIQQFVDRFRAKASKAKQVQSRIKALERMQLNASIHADSPYSVTFKNPEKVSNPLFTFRNLSAGYADTVVLKDVSQTILPGTRIGVLGANGAGKTTLLRTLVGELTPLSGEFSRGQHSQVGYFAQHQMEALNVENQALQTLMAAKPDWTEQQCRNYLGGWGFPAEMTTRPIHTLSGGEKARLVLSLVAVETPAVLILDEPTNHLDLEMRDALAMALQEYSGTVIIVSHDRSLLDKTVDDFWVIQAGSLAVFSGDLSDYTTAIKPQRPRTESTHQSKKNLRKERAQRRENLGRLRKQVKELESKLDKFNLELKQMETKLADQETYASMPTEELDALLARTGRYRNRVKETEEAWLSASEKLEA